MLNVSRQAISKWESGKGYPEIDKLIFICDYFNVSLDYLLRDNESEQKENKYPILNNIKIMEGIKQFYNNLSVKQQHISIILLIVIGIGIIASICNSLIGIGEHIGKGIYYLSH